EAIENAPDDWREVLIDSISEFESAGTELSSQIADDLRGVLQETMSLTFCATDYLAIFIAKNVQEIKHNKWPDRYDEPAYTPQVCSTTPVTEITPETDYIEYVGFFFNRYGGEYSTTIEDQYDNLIYSGFPMVITTDTRMTVALINTGIAWDVDFWRYAQSPKFVLAWDGGKSEIFVNPGVVTWLVDNRDEIKISSNGGSGGSAFSYQCSDGYVITHLQVRAGSRVDALRVGCSELKADGTYELNAQKRQWSARFGGSGGSEYADSCPDGKLMTSFFGKAGSNIDNIGFECLDVNRLQDGDYRFASIQGPFGGSGGGEFTSRCPKGYAMTGVEGRAGSRIDQLRGVCSRVLSE
ncbi:MAG: hypothetical protein R3208_12875, partial [Ketobacteraceae bacterium]|nr:hypothetical protein [Ketobacteraceae bacterium]